MHIPKLLVAASASGIMLAGLVSPASASTNIAVSGNGRLARTKINLSFSNSNVINQTSTTITTNTVDTKSNTGDNEIEDNTISGKKSDPTVVLSTGSIITDVGISNEGGSNYLVTNPCDCQLDPHLNLKVTGNGNKTKTEVNISTNNSNSTNQTTTTTQTNSVTSHSNTGNNEIEDNTISGGNTKLKLKTGGISTGVTIINTSGSNWIGPVFP